jgi:hypothetical protein
MHECGTATVTHGSLTPPLSILALVHSCIKAES